MSVVTEKAVFLQPLNEGELSSAGLEHLPYKQRVTGSNPVAPTIENSDLMEIKSLFLYSGRNYFGIMQQLFQLPYLLLAQTCSFDYVRNRNTQLK